MAIHGKKKHTTKPVTKHDPELSNFIKENIINKKPEFPEYDNATPESTLSDLMEESKKVSEQSDGIYLDGKKLRINNRNPKVNFNADKKTSTIKIDNSSKPYCSFRNEDLHEADRYIKEKTEENKQKFSKWYVSNNDVSVMPGPLPRPDDETIKYIINRSKEIEEEENRKNRSHIDESVPIFPDDETVQYVLDALDIKKVNATDNTISECLDKIYVEIKSLRHNIVITSQEKYNEQTDFLIRKLLTIAPYVDIFRFIEHVYIINGYARSGKDTFVEMAGEIFDFLKASQSTTKSISSVQGIKDISTTYFGYDDNYKTDKDRKFLSDFKSLTTDYCDYCLKYVLREIVMADISGYSYVFIHIREPEEIDKALVKIDELIFPHFSLKITEYEDDFDKLMKAKKFYAPKTIFIKRNTEHKVTNNTSDTNVENFDYDFVIDNNGTLEYLRVLAKNFAITEYAEDESKWVE